MNKHKDTATKYGEAGARLHVTHACLRLLPGASHRAHI
jgi:hypothetical protein